MSALIELVSGISVNADWQQPTDTVVDVSGYTEAAVMVCVHGMGYVSGTISLKIETAVDNRNGSYVAIAKKDYTSGPSCPDYVYFYLHGSTNGTADGTKSPGFGRYIRMAATVPAGEVSFSAKVVVKP